MRGMAFILIALFIDGLQACVSLGLFFIAANAGTVAGGTGGCIAGHLAFGEIGCWVGGIALGAFGTFGNAAAAPFLIPVGIALGFAVNFCLSATLGAGLVFLLWLNGMFYPQYVFGGGLAELLPGLDNLPAWTLMVALSLMRKNAEEGKSGLASTAIRSVLSPQSALGAAAGAITAANQTARVRTQAPEPGAATVSQEREPRRLPELKSVDGVRRPSNSATPYAQAA